MRSPLEDRRSAVPTSILACALRITFPAILPIRALVLPATSGNVPRPPCLGTFATPITAICGSMRGIERSSLPLAVAPLKPPHVLAKVTYIPRIVTRPPTQVVAPGQERHCHLQTGSEGPGRDVWRQPRLGLLPTARAAHPL